MIDLITGHQGVAHISAEQIANINNALMDDYGVDKVVRLDDGTLTQDGLTINVGTGFWRVNGFDMEIQEAETVYIDPTATGLSRIDNIYVEILQDIPTGSQRSEIVTVQGEAAASPVAPDVPTAPVLNTDILLQVTPLATVTVTEGAMVMTDLSVAYEKANKSDLTSINVTGTTNSTGSTISSGTYFYLNGTLVKAKVDIANGATFTKNTNYEEVTAGSLNDMNSKMDYMFNIIRGRQLPIVDLGTSYSSELKSDISSGRFEKAIVGGKLTINGHVYYLAHPDYWLRTGDIECTKHHMLVVPARNLASGKMNNDNSTAGGYIGSGMKSGTNHDESTNSALADVAAIIKADFGAVNILTHREYFTNAVANGKPSAGAWYDSDIDLMNENMVYGTNIFLLHPDGSTVPNLYTIDKTQIKLFAERPDLITIRASWWLRDVVPAAYFARVSDDGNAGYTNASYSIGVRPAFAIC